ncbi:MAG: hypothetical protein WAT44_01660 [Microgenomates group bacterium]
MVLNEKIIELLLLFKSISAISPVIDIESSTVKILSSTFSKDKILLNDSYDLGKNIIGKVPTHSNDLPNMPNIAIFLNAISSKVLRLNHIGVSYWCENIENELLEYQNAIKGSDLKVYEEFSGNPKNRWFFLRSDPKWTAPLIEIVLNQSKNYYEDEWMPHFQIDIDTSLDYKELIFLTNKFLKHDFFSWNMNIPNYGVVLGMGLLGTINNTKIYLGLGTNLRNTKYHREVSLKEVK